MGNRKHPQRFVSGRAAFSNWQLLAPCLLLLWIGGYGQHLTLSRQFIFDEMSRMGANTFLEDSYGFIWIGAGGLYRYDGYTIQPYRPVLHDSAVASAGAVYALLEDSKNRIWIGASNGLFLYDRETDQIERKLVKKAQRNGRGFGILSLLEDRAGRLWIGDEEHLMVMEGPDDIRVVEGISLNIRIQVNVGFTTILEGKNGEIIAASRERLWVIGDDYCAEPYLPDKWAGSAVEHQILDAATDEEGLIWIATTDGLWQFDPVKKAFSQKGLPSGVGNVIQKVIIGKEDEIWLGSLNTGLFKLKNGKAERYVHDPDNPYSLMGNNFRELMFDHFNNLWIGAMAGINKINFGQQKLPFYQIDPGPHRRNNYTHRVLRDHLGGYWFRLINLGLGYSSQLGGEFEVLLQPAPNTSIEEIKHFCVDEDGNVWVITLTNGLYKFEKGQKRYSHISLGDSLRTADPLDIIADKKDSRHLWFSSRFGLCRVNRFTFSRKWFAPKLSLPWLDGDEIDAIDQSDDGNIWCRLRSKGSNLMGYFDIKKEKFVAEPGRPGHPSSFAFSSTRHVRSVPGNKVWVGTNNGLIIIDATNNTYTHLTEKDGLPGKNIQSITPDLEGNIWIAGSYKICKYDGVGFQCYDARNGIENFNYSSAALGKDGRITFGGRNGIYSFYPNEIEFKVDTVRPKVYLTNFKVFDKQQPLGQAFELVKEITIPFIDNVIAFQFTTLHSPHSERCRYRYKLEGFEKNWVETGHDVRQATYTNLSPGKYTFKVRAANADGFWTNEEDELSVGLTILPPWYRTWLAYFLYLLAFASLLLFIRRYELRRQLARAEARQLKELDATKTRLYTNITHEFRTPLTIITGILGHLESRVDFTARNDLKRVQRNARQLLSLVNQMLSLARLESGNLPVNNVKADVITFIKYLLESFHSLAEEKNISLQFDSSVDGLIMDFDAEKLRQIVGNLLSNAVKFTPQGGWVRVEIGRCVLPGAGLAIQPRPTNNTQLKAGTYLSIVVSDSGVGIPKDELPNVFNRFYQVDDSSTRSGEGTGIGLALTRELVKLLGGQIDVKSESGKGAKFIVLLPATNDAEVSAIHSIGPFAGPADDMVTPSMESTVPITTEASLLSTSATSKTPKETLLIIEDNPDVTHYLTTILNRDYYILTAPNGKTGLEIAQQRMPHLILSDVMMPEMDGYEVCQQLKADVNTSHIPIILLTAKADFDSRMEGLEYGADAYLAKPFEERELQLLLKKLLENRERLRQFYTSGGFISRSASSPSPDEPLNIRDQTFFRQLVSTVEDHLSDPSFSAEMLSRELYMAYSTCLRKVKAATGKTVNEYIRHIRMHRAARMLADEPERTITSIALDVGFTSSSYFSREFRKVMGCSPTAFRDQRK
ncbi:MAG: response regulator [Phaeodactylibacter sp.]|nr:response regulator [Phaeodactylibacter sp.]